MTAGWPAQRSSRHSRRSRRPRWPGRAHWTGYGTAPSFRADVPSASSCRHVSFEVQPALPLIVVEFADAATTQELSPRPAVDNIRSRQDPVQSALRLVKLIKGDRCVQVVGGMLEDPVQQPLEWSGKLDVCRAGSL